MKNRILGLITTSLLGTCLACAEEAKTNENNDRVIFFNVPLRCEAVPEIGCGSRAKPVLLELQRQPDVSEAWLNGTGTIIAVVRTDGVSGESLVGAIKSTLKNTGADGAELTGGEREAALRSFASRTDWYRGADVDKLSKREAAVIAARLVRRVQTNISLPEERARTLVADLTQAIEDRFISDAKTPKQEFEESVLNLVRKNLDEKGVAAFREAAAKGVRPLPEDKEGATNKVPACCSINLGKT